MAPKMSLRELQKEKQVAASTTEKIPISDTESHTATTQKKRKENYTTGLSEDNLATGKDSLSAILDDLLGDWNSLWDENFNPGPVIDALLEKDPDMVKEFEGMDAKSVCQVMQIYSLRMAVLARAMEKEFQKMEKKVQNFEAMELEFQKVKEEIKRLKKQCEDLALEKNYLVSKLAEEKGKLESMKEHHQKEIEDLKMEAYKAGFDHAIGQIRCLYPGIDLSKVGYFKEIRDGQLCDPPSEDKED